MDELTFYILDVFAEQKYAGNQLAVFREAGGLSGEEMLSIAREINFSETTFILSDEQKQGGYDVRIFTPKEEVPFAGHPTLGTAAIIHSQILRGSSDQVLLNLKVGQIPVTFHPDGYSWMKQMAPSFGAQYSTETMAEVLGIESAEIDARFPVQEVSTGLPFFIVPLKNMAALKQAKTNLEKYFDLIRDTAAKAILVFCPETHEPQNQLCVRVFTDYYGMPEDPATGSANGCLAGYLTKYRYFGQDRIDIRCEQGYEIDRPSLLLLKAEQNDGQIDIWVGGKSVLVAQGQFLPEDGAAEPAKKYTLEEAGKRFAMTLNGKVWELLGKAPRTREEDERMVHAAHASCAHWLNTGTGVHQQRAEWLIGHVYSELGLADSALRHALRCLELTEEFAEEMKDFDRAYAYEGAARAYALAGEQEQARLFIRLAQERGEAIADAEDRSIFFGDFEGGKWHGLK